eukprot:6184884-Pleurochrysis_carterae.AAC.1
MSGATPPCGEDGMRCASTRHSVVLLVCQALSSLASQTRWTCRSVFFPEFNRALASCEQEQERLSSLGRISHNHPLLSCSPVPYAARTATSTTSRLLHERAFHNLIVVDTHQL